MHRLIILVSLAIAIALSVFLYAKRLHRNEQHPSAPLLPHFDPAKPAFRTSLPDWPIRGPIVVRELPEAETEITL